MSLADLYNRYFQHSWGDWERKEWAPDDQSVHPFQRGTYWQKRTCKKCGNFETEHGPLAGQAGIVGSAHAGPCTME